MRWPLKWFRPARESDRVRKQVSAALNLVGRGGDGSNSLQLESVDLRLRIAWRARELHAWDRDLPPERATRRFTRQCLTDTEAALERLFTAYPGVDLIEMTVHEPDPGSTGILMIGSVSRKEFESWHPLSIAMHLRLVGVNYLLVDGRIQRLTAPAAATEQIFGMPGLSQRFRGGAREADHARKRQVALSNELTEKR
jgi:hypothetical protein